MAKKYTILKPFSKSKNRKWAGMKNRVGNSRLRSLPISPNLNRKVFHTRVNAQNTSTNCIRALIPANTKVRIWFKCRLMSLPTGVGLEASVVKIWEALEDTRSRVNI